MNKIKDLKGKSFGRLLVISYSHQNNNKNAVWKCLCECGNILNVTSTSLISGNTKSCGCLNKEILRNRKTHGAYTNYTQSPEYVSWHAMKTRCFNKNTPTYNHYGGRGITVCDRWLKFENFLEDMGLRPSLKHTLDRYPNKDGNYEPSNCRWATSIEQASNKNSNTWLEHNGERKILKEWADYFNVKSSTLLGHLKRKTFDETYIFYQNKKMKNEQK